MQKLVDGYSEMIGQFMHLIQANRFFAPDPSIGTIITDIQQAGHFVNK